MKTSQVFSTYFEMILYFIEILCDLADMRRNLLACSSVDVSYMKWNNVLLEKRLIQIWL